MRRLPLAVSVLCMWTACGRVHSERSGSDSNLPATDAGRGPVVDASARDARIALDGSLDARMVDGGAQPCGERYPGAIWCEDFEGSAPDLRGGAELQPTTVRRGDFAVRVSSDGAATGTVEYPLPPGAERLYARAYLRVAGSFTVDGPDGWAVLMPFYNQPATQKISADLMPGPTWQLGKGVEPRMFIAGPALERGRWSCVELAAEIGSNGSASLSLDGTVVATASMTNTVPSGTPLSLLAVGIIATYRVSGPLEVYVDDVVLSTSPIGCD